MRRLVILALLLVAGCSPTKDAKAPKLVPVEGQVFIVTKGRENLKMALVTVEVFPESTAQRAVEGRKALFARSQSGLDSLAAATKVAQAFLARANRAIAKHEEAVSAVGAEPRYDYQREWVEETRNAAARAGEGLAPVRATLNALISRYGAFGTDSWYFEALPRSAVNTKTDADGKFTISLPAGRRVVLAAQAGREIAGDTESYYWLVWFTPRDSTENRIMPSNDNLMTSGSPESVVLVAAP